MRSNIYSKYLILVILLSSFLLPVQAKTNVDKIEKSIKSFAQALLEDTITSVPQEFKLTLNDFRQLVALSTNNRMSEDELVRIYAQRINVIERKFKKALKLLNHPSELVSYDTLTYTSDNVPQITVALVFKTRDYRTNKKTNIRVLFHFLILENKLILSRNLMRKKDDYDYDKYISQKIQTTRGSDLYAVYKNIWFNSSDLEVVPFKQLNKWGLKKLNGTVFLEAEYDSIYAFKKDYALVVKDGKYNLLNENLEFEFAEFQNKIERRSTEYFFDLGYFVQQNDGTFKKYPYPLSSNKEESEDVEVSEDDYLAQYSSNKKEKALSYSQKIAKSKPNLFEVKLMSYGKNLEFYKYFVVAKSTKDTITQFNNYEYVATPHEFIFTKNEGVTVLLNKNLDTLFISKFVCIYESAAFIDVFDSSTRLYGMYCPYTNVYIEPKYKYLKAIDRDRFFIVFTTDGKFGYLDSNGNELFD